MILQISWGHPQHAWWLLAIPAAMLVVAGYILWKKKTLRKLADAQLLPALLVRYRPVRERVSQLLLIVALALLTVAMLNPQEPADNAGTTLSGLEVVVAIDVSNSMLAKDLSPNRLERARLLARQLMDTLQGSKVGIVAFAGEAWTVLPLTTDLAAARLQLSALQTHSVPTQGTNIASALQTANASLPITDMQHKAIVLFTDGEALEGNGLDAAKELKASGVMLVAVGMGTPAGATVTDETGLALRQEDGSPVVSKLDEKGLQELAAATGGRYTLLKNNENAPALAEVLNSLNELPKKPLTNSYMVNYYSYAHWLMAIAVVLLLASISMRQGGTKLKKQAVAAGLFLLFGPGTAMAQKDPEGSIPKANELFKSGKLEEAEAMYKSVLRQDPAAWQAQLHLGNIAYRRGQHEEALKWYDQTMKQAVPDDASVALLNNKGLAYVKMKRLPEAIETFKQAIRQSPFDEGLQTNLGMALEELARARQTPREQPKQQPQNQRKAEDRLQALQEEEKKIRQQLMKQKRSAPNNGKNW